ncbi:hypothetical protein [Qipengyuania sp. DGS5-3]|uniref:hypothetical protein n=1 Tax=Qipengyuania sp. DGS5-3 TaxID=3349632 RepID=UPI0036D2C88C
MAIERVVDAYGGQRLVQLRTISIDSDRRLAWPGQGQTAAFVEFEIDRVTKHFDLVSEHGSVERWTHQNGNVYHNRYVVTASGVSTIDYFDMTQTPSETGGYWQWFSGDYRSADTLLAHLLATNPPEIEYAGEATYRGRHHDLIAFTVTPDSPQVTLYIDRDSGLIHRLVMKREIGEVNILFSAHAKSGGIAFAGEVHIFLDDDLTEYEQTRNITFNEPVSAKIAIEDGLTLPAPAPDLSEMTVDEIAPNVFVVGRGDYSLFVEHEGQLLGVNAYAGLRERYLALIAHLGKPTPLASMIVTHHHSDHMDAVLEAAALGATLHLTDQTNTVLEGRDNWPDNLKVELLGRRSDIGPLSVFVKATGHATQNALVYHAATRTLFADDHYHGLARDAPSRIQPSARELHGIIGQLELDVGFMLSGHARKAEMWEVFDQAVTTSSNDVCPSNRVICSDQKSGG